MNPPPRATVKCATATSVLLVVDVQERLGKAMPTKVLSRVVQNTALLCRSAGLLDVPVLQTEQYPEGLGPTHPTVLEALPPATANYAKTAFSACGSDAFRAALTACARDTVIIVGMEAHVCILQTALDLAASGHEVFVVEDAICSRRLENYQNALERLRQVGVQVTSAESVVFEWLGDARHPRFKEVQRLLR